MGILIQDEDWRDMEKIQHALRSVRNLTNPTEAELQRAVGHMHHLSDRLSKLMRQIRSEQTVTQEAHSG